MKWLIGLVCFGAVAIILLGYRPSVSKLPGAVTITSLDQATQTCAQATLNQAMAETQARKGLVMVMDVQTGRITALASTDPTMAAQPWQPGSIMKPLTVAAALDQGVITPKTSYFDKGTTTIDGFTIRNVVVGSGTRDVQDVLSYSLNTGAIFVLKAMGGGQLNSRARQAWYEYLTEHYQLNQATHTGLAGERAGYVRDPSNSRGSALAYASSSFGVNVTASPVQLLADYAALSNGGVYHAPWVNGQAANNGQGKRILSTQTSATITDMLQKVAAFKEIKASSGYVVGVKSGTAPAPDDRGDYTPYGDNGSFIGFFGKGKPEQVMIVRLDRPVTSDNQIASMVAAKYWTALADKLMEIPHEKN